jgi:hypothetical protein
MKYIIPGVQKSRNELFDIALALGRYGHNWDRCEDILNQLMRANPSDVPYGNFIRLFEENRQFSRVQRLLENLQMRYPGDTTVQKEMRYLRQLIIADSIGSKRIPKK